MPQQPTKIIDLTFLGTDNHRTTHDHLLTFAYRNLITILKPEAKQNVLKENPKAKLFSEIADNENTHFIDDSSIQMRLFDGVGCKGTKNHPRPGNYTWDKQFKKTERQPNEIISHHLAKATGEGMQALIQEAEDYIDFIIKKNSKGTLPKTINLKGYSRGADACIRLANRIYEKYPQIKINMFLVDPVPGPFHRDDDGSYIIPGNIERLDVTFMKDEKIRFYKPQHMGRLVIQNPLTTKVTEHYLAGVHGEALYIDQGIPKKDQKIQSHTETQQNLIQFIRDTTGKIITLPRCFRDRTKPSAQQFTYTDSIPNSAPIQKDNSQRELQQNILLASSNTVQKSYFRSFRTLFHQTRTLAQERHDDFATKFKSTQSNELKFLIKQCKDAQHFYHYHHHESKRSVFETLYDAIQRIGEIFQGKSKQKRNKLFPNEYALIKIKEALDYQPTQDKISELSTDIQNLLTIFINDIKNWNISIDREPIEQCEDILKKYQNAHQLYEKMKGKEELNPLDYAIIPQNTFGYIPREKSSHIAELDKTIQEKMRIQKINQTIKIIQQSNSSHFFSKSLQTYQEYQDQFISKVHEYLLNVDQLHDKDFGLFSLEEKFTFAQNILKNLINKETDPKILHQLYAIGQPPYIQPFMLSERKNERIKQEESARKIQIDLSRRM